MRIVAATVGLLLTSPLLAQTVEEQIETKVAEIAALCAQANPGIVGCYIIAQPGECPDPLEGTRAQLEKAAPELEAAAQAINQVLEDNPK